MASLSSKYFLERALPELREIRDEVIDLATDRDIYWKVQKEVIQLNPRLVTARNPFLNMLNDGYAHAAAMRIRRLVDKDNRTISLRRLLDELREYPDLFSAVMTKAELASDADRMHRETSEIKAYVDQFIAHHDRTPVATIPIYRALNAAIDLLIQLLKKYYAMLAGADVGVVVHYLEDPLAIFRFAWIERKN